MRVLRRWALMVSVLALVLSLSGCARSDDAVPNQTKPELVLQLGHVGGVTALAFSPDGQTLASAGVDGIIRLSDARTGELKQTLAGNRASVRSLKYSSNGSLLGSLTGENDMEFGGGFVLFDTSNHKVLRTWPDRGKDNYGSNNITAFAFAPDSKTLVLASLGGEPEQSQITLWDIATGKQQATIVTLKQKVRALAFSSDGKNIAAGRQNEIGNWRKNAITSIWDVATHKIKRTFRSEGKSYPRLNDDGFYDIAFTPDGKTLAASSIFGEEMGGVTVVWLWDVETGRLKRRLEVLGFGMNLAISGDGKTLVSSGGMWAQGTVVFWDMATGRKKRVLKGVCALFPYFALSPDGKTLATNDLFPNGEATDISDLDSPTGNVQLWNVSTGKVLHTLRGRSLIPIRAVAVAPNGSRFASVCTDPAQKPSVFRRNVRLWDAHNTHLQATIQGTEPIAFSADGKLLAMDDEVPHVRQKLNRKRIEPYWDQNTGSEKGDIEPERDGRIAVRDASTGKLLRSFQAAPNAIAFSSDGKLLAAQSFGDIKTGHTLNGSSWGSLRIWDLSTGKPRCTMRTLSTTPGMTIAFSPDIACIATVGLLDGETMEGAVQLWDTQTGKLRMTLRVGKLSSTDTGRIYSVVFSADGKTVIGRSLSGLFFWDVATGERLRAIKTNGYSGSADAMKQSSDLEGRAPLAISPDGTIIATETDEYSIKLWNAQTGEFLRELKGGGNGVLTLAFAPDGKTLLSGSNDGTMKLWNPQTGALLLTIQLISISHGEAGTMTDWISYAPDGHYDGSLNIEKYIRWRVGDELFPAAKFQAQMHRPDLIARVLSATRAEK